jgi:hypothetical protein
VCGHELTIHLRHPDWKELLDKELALCSKHTVPLCKPKDLNLRKESANMFKELSQLSFEELEGKMSVLDAAASPRCHKERVFRHLEVC